MYIQELSHQLNLSKKAINLYEQKGLICPKKDKLGYRVYSHEDYLQLLKIQQLRQFDFSLAEIKEILIDNHYQSFENKINNYYKKKYRIETSIQFLDDLKTSLQNNHIEELAIDMNPIFEEIQELTIDQENQVDFDKIIFCCMFIAMFFYSIAAQENIWCYLALAIWFLACLLQTSARIRVFFLKIYQIIKNR